MSAFDEIVAVEYPSEDISDRELLASIYRSQVETERLVREFIATVQPTVEKFSRGGILGMLGH